MNRIKSFFFITSALVLAVFVFAGLPGCNSKPAKDTAAIEKPIPAASPQPSAAAVATPVPKLPPPTQAEVKAAFQRVFGSDLIAQFSLATFIVGDFNGDEFEDIAIIARPAPGKLEEVNSELANWIIQDADKALIPPPAAKKVVIPPNQQRPRIGQDEEVLAIIHGYGPQGWRNPEARQAYLIKHAAATFLETAPSISQKAIRAMKLPYETEIIKQVRNNKKGFLFWTGGVYAWHPSEG
jgi:hypothetical protein